MTLVRDDAKLNNIIQAIFEISGDQTQTLETVSPPPTTQPQPTSQKPSQPSKTETQPKTAPQPEPVSVC